MLNTIKVENSLAVGELASELWIMVFNMMPTQFCRNLLMSFLHILEEQIDLDFRRRISDLISTAVSGIEDQSKKVLLLMESDLK